MAMMTGEMTGASGSREPLLKFPQERFHAFSFLGPIADAQIRIDGVRSPYARRLSNGELYQAERGCADNFPTLTTPSCRQTRHQFVARASARGVREFLASACEFMLLQQVKSRDPGGMDDIPTRRTFFVIVNDDSEGCVGDCVKGSYHLV